MYINKQTTCFRLTSDVDLLVAEEHSYGVFMIEASRRMQRGLALLNSSGTYAFS